MTQTRLFRTPLIKSISRFISRLADAFTAEITLESCKRSAKKG